MKEALDFALKIPKNVIWLEQEDNILTKEHCEPYFQASFCPLL